MLNTIKYSFIIPVFNRPDEIYELLESFCNLDFVDDFEIVIIEDGSTIKCNDIVSFFNTKLDISYHYKKNSGPGSSRNFGMKIAKGNYFIILDSDCILPSHYLNTVNQFLETEFYHCFGGADTSDSSFSSIQLAINYTMTSLLSTGGIRGNNKSIQKFEPRSFNMGLSKEVFNKTNGFSNIHPGEDPDLSYRILELNYQTVFIPNAFVYHKRRISWSKFYLQISKFGLVRPILNKWHPKSAKFTFWLPTIFILFSFCSIFLGIYYNSLFFVPLLSYLFLIVAGSTFKNKSLLVGLYSLIALFIQFTAYGLSFLKSTFLINFLKRDPEKQFPKLFFK